MRDETGVEEGFTAGAESDETPHDVVPRQPQSRQSPELSVLSGSAVQQPRFPPLGG